MASVQAISSSTYVPPVKPQAPAPQTSSKRTEESREPAQEARSEASSRTEEPAPPSSQVGSRVNLTA